MIVDTFQVRLYLSKIIGLFFFARRRERRFKFMLNYLEEKFEFQVDEKFDRYIRLIDFYVLHNIFRSMLFISFSLTESRERWGLLSKLRGPIKYDHIYDVKVEPGTNYTGDQIFYYIFNNSSILEDNLDALVNFIHHEYISPIELSNENEIFWNKLLFGR